MRNYLAAVVALCLASAGTAQENHNRVVYWGNSSTGNAVRVMNKRDAEKLAEAQVKAKGGSEWVLYENSSVPGYGAAMCTRRGDTILFHTVHGFKTGKEAIRAASEKAKASGGTTSLCSNGLWLVNGSVTPKETNIIDSIKDTVQDAVQKQPCPPATGSAEARLSTPRRGEISKPLQEEKEVCAEGGTSTGKIPCMCVRG